MGAGDDGSTPIAGCTDDASGDDKWTACADVDGAREVADANRPRHFQWTSGAINWKST